MAQEAKDKKGNKVKFIRKNGRVIPIRSKGGSADNSKSKRKHDKATKIGKKAGKDYDRGTKVVKKAAGERTKQRKPFVTAGLLAGVVGGAYAGKKTLLTGLVGGLAGGLIGGKAGRAVADRTKKGKKISKRLKKGRRLQNNALSAVGRSGDAAGDAMYRQMRSSSGNTGF